MIEFLVLGALVAVALLVAAVLGVVVLALKLAVWAVLLPFRLLWKLITIPIWLTLGALGLVAGAVALPVVLFGVVAVAVVGVLAAVLAILLPAIPFVLLGLLVWALFRRSPAVA